MILLYLLIIIDKTIIKANAIIVVIIQVAKSNTIICNIVCSIISITSLSLYKFEDIRFIHINNIATWQTFVKKYLQKIKAKIATDTKQE